MIIPVDLGNRSYNICIDEKEPFAEKIRGMFPSSQFVLVTNKTVEKIYEKTIAAWEQTIPLARYVIEDGEKYKTLATWNTILEFLLESRFDRGAVIIAFGGGVVGDIAGFCASSFLRGVAYMQFPTTLLAMVDSSVGGKVGVNHAKGKNLIGAIYQPKLVWIDTAVLNTLPKRQYISGYGEVYKYAFIGGRKMFDFILANHAALLNQDKETLETAIKRSIEIKAGIVSEDEHETGKRALVNFGHTFGHALERFYHFKDITHGEGVCWGITCAVELAKRAGTIPEKHLPRYEAILEKHVLPDLPSKPDIEEVYSAMFHDKKVRAGKLRFVLPAEPGTSIIRDDIPKQDIVAVLQKVFA